MRRLDPQICTQLEALAHELPLASAASYSSASLSQLSLSADTHLQPSYQTPHDATSDSLSCTSWSTDLRAHTHMQTRDAARVALTLCPLHARCH